MPEPLANPEMGPPVRTMAGVRREVGGAYERNIRGRPVEASTIATVAYFVTLIVVRAFVTATQGETHDYLVIAGVHVHHLVIGIVAILIAGVFALDEVLRLTRAVLFGIGAALVLDEFALLVFLRDVYWLPQGTLSVFALGVGLLALIVNAWRGRAFIQDVTGSFRRR